MEGPVRGASADCLRVLEVVQIHLGIIIVVTLHAGALAHQRGGADRVAGAGAVAGEASGVGSAATPFATSLPGIFAVGDVRAGSVKRVASSVGDADMGIGAGSVTIEQSYSTADRHHNQIEPHATAARVGPGAHKRRFLRSVS